MKSRIYDSLITSFSINVIRGQAMKNFAAWLLELFIIEVSVLVTSSIDNKAQWDLAD
jgi:hypothetical protein